MNVCRKQRIRQNNYSLMYLYKKVNYTLFLSSIVALFLLYSCDPPNTVTPEHIPTGITTIPFRLFSNGNANPYCVFNNSSGSGFVYITIQYLDIDGKMSQWGETQKYNAYELGNDNARIKVPGNVRFAISCTNKSPCEMCCDSYNPNGCSNDANGFRRYGRPMFQGQGGFYNRLPPNASMYGTLYGKVMSFSGCVDCGCL